MTDAIEPSEIIIEGKSKNSSTWVAGDPQLRFLARFIDYSLYFWVLLVFRFILGGYFPFRLFEFYIPFEYLSWVGIEAVLLHLVGTTPGKWFLSISLFSNSSQKLSWESALRRSFNVWLKGMGMAIPIFGFLCMVFANNRLKILKKTSWDLRENIDVVYGKVKPWKIWASGLFIFSSFLIYYANKYSM